MKNNVEGLGQHSELRKRILFTVVILAVYRFGVHVPTPGIDSSAVLGFFESQGGVFGLLNTFTGGALNQFSVFALGIMPYISSSIIFQLLTAAIPYLEQLKKEGEHGRKKIQQYTRYGTVLLAIIQAFAISSWLGNSDFEGRPLVLAPFVGFMPFELLTVLTLTAGSIFVMWLGEQITDRGLGEGASLIIFAGIAAQILPGALSLFGLWQGGEMITTFVLFLLAIMAAVIVAIVFLEIGQRRVPIHFSRRGGSQPGMTQASYLPFKINMAGVIPVIFASSLLLFPATLTEFFDSPVLGQLSGSLEPTGAIYNILLVALIVFFCFFYVELVMNPKEISDNLKKEGKFVPGIRAGKSTSEYLQFVMDRINVGGAVYLSAVCVLPGLFMDYLGTPFYFGGTSLLILISVALNTSQKVESHLLTQRYDALMRGAKQKARRVQY